MAVGPTKVKASKSILSTEGIPEVKIKTLYDAKQVQLNRIFK